MSRKEAIELINFVRFGGPGSGRTKEGGSDSEPSTPKISATDESVTTLMEKAKESGAEVDKLTKDIANKNAATATEVNYKSANSIVRKTNEEEKGDITKIKDSVRTTIIHDDPNSVKNIINDLKNSPEVMNGGRIKTQDAESNPLGYSGNIVNFTTANGTVAEIQVNTPKMIYAKEDEKTARSVLGDKRYNEIYKQTGVKGGEGHKMYEEYRLLKPEKDSAKMIEIENKSKKYYKNFYN